MKGNLVVGLAGMLLPLVAGAIEDKEIAACAADSNTVTRLSCYDALAEKNALAPRIEKKPETAGTGKWHISSNIDPLNDKTVYFANLAAVSGTSRHGDSPIMTVRCGNKQTEWYINWYDYLGSEAKTTFRVDKEQAKTLTWTLSTDKVAAFYPGSPVSVLKKIAEGTSFVANVTPYNESPVTAVFDITGAGAALADIRKNCGW